MLNSIDLPPLTPGEVDHRESLGQRRIQQHEGQVVGRRNLVLSPLNVAAVE